MRKVEKILVTQTKKKLQSKKPMLSKLIILAQKTVSTLKQTKRLRPSEEIARFYPTTEGMVSLSRN